LSVTSSTPTELVHSPAPTELVLSPCYASAEPLPLVDGAADEEDVIAVAEPLSETIIETHAGEDTIEELLAALDEEEAPTDDGGKAAGADGEDLGEDAVGGEGKPAGSAEADRPTTPKTTKKKKTAKAKGKKGQKSKKGKKGKKGKKTMGRKMAIKAADEENVEKTRRRSPTSLRRRLSTRLRRLQLSRRELFQPFRASSRRSLSASDAGRWLIR